MLFQGVLLSGFLLAGTASAKALAANALFPRGHDIEYALRRDADMVATLTQRQEPNSPVENAPKISTTPASGDVTQADLAEWEDKTKAACDSAMQKLEGRASNPSGLAVCYNLPYLNNQTGVFQADLRMYNISTPIDPWLGITSANVNLTLSYLGATVNVTGAHSKREVTISSIKERGISNVLVERQNGNAPTQLKVIMYVGRINDNLMGTAMTQENLQPLLIPNIELTARSPNGMDVMATLSSQEASFVNGVFAGQVASMTTDAQAQASASAAVESSAPFVVPGTSLAFFPIGLVITSIWTIAFVGTVGMGTIGRVQFRDQYRRRMKLESSRNVRTI
jgi:hypothetical protein